MSSQAVPCWRFEPALTHLSSRPAKPTQSGHGTARFPVGRVVSAAKFSARRGLPTTVTTENRVLAVYLLRERNRTLFFEVSRTAKYGDRPTPMKPACRFPLPAILLFW